jgi:putative ABC transport system ATP-binding protein
MNRMAIGARRLMTYLTGSQPLTEPRESPDADSISENAHFNIETNALGKTYITGDVGVDVLKDISLSVVPGEFVSIMGPSGSGKSTLLYLLGGLDAPTTGKVFIKGRDISRLSDPAASQMRRQDIGFVFQFYNLVPNLDVEENILLPVLLDGKDLRMSQELLDEILETVGLSDHRKHTPRELSGGQQQRVAIARALMNEPDIILADEPTGNLDSHSGEEVMELLGRINDKKGRTIVMVTHSRVAAAFGRRLINVKDGRIVGDEKI